MMIVSISHAPRRMPKPLRSMRRAPFPVARSVSRESRDHKEKAGSATGTTARDSELLVGAVGAFAPPVVEQLGDAVGEDGVELAADVGVAGARLDALGVQFHRNRITASGVERPEYGPRVVDDAHARLRLRREQLA